MKCLLIVQSTIRQTVGKSGDNSAIEIPDFAGMVQGGRGIVGGFWRRCGRQLTCRLRRILRGVAAFYCEIPAYAGMVLWEAGDCWRILVLLSAHG